MGDAPDLVGYLSFDSTFCLALPADSKLGYLRFFPKGGEDSRIGTLQIDLFRAALPSQSCLTASADGSFIRKTDAKPDEVHGWELANMACV